MRRCVDRTRSLLLRIAYAVCLLGGTWTHLQVALTHGLWWDYGGVSLVTRVLYLSQIVFLLFVAITVRMAWHGVPARSTARLGVSRTGST
jgi:hypothetical protein